MKLSKPTPKPKPPARGAPRGSRNAAKGPAPRVGRIAQRVPLAIQERWEAAASAAGCTVADLLIERAP
jgi:hypothetical protein